MFTMIDESSIEYYKTEEYKWGKIKRDIESRKIKWGVKNLDLLPRRFNHGLINENGEQKFYSDSDAYAEFEQFDGTKVKITREIVHGLTVVREAIFVNSDGSEIFRLSSTIPKEYTLVEGCDASRDFHDYYFKVICVQFGFLETVGGRFGFIHEFGHAKDYVENPQTNEDAALDIERLDNPARENAAWEQATKLLDEMRKHGFSFLPEWFEEFDSTKWIELFKKHHKYPTPKK